MYEPFLHAQDEVAGVTDLSNLSLVSYFEESFGWNEDITLYEMEICRRDEMVVTLGGGWLDCYYFIYNFIF